MAGVEGSVRDSSSRGLYRRALAIQGHSGVPAPDGSGVPEEAIELEDEPGALDGITREERLKIEEEVDAVTAGAPVRSDAFSFAARRKGSFLPLVTNAAAVAVIALGLLALVRIFGGEEQGIVASARGVVGAEGEVVAAIREESALRLAEKDREVEAALRRLKDLADERDRIRAAAASAPVGDAQAAARAAELERRIAEATAALDRAREQRRALEAEAAPAAAPAPPATAAVPQPIAEPSRLAGSEALALERLAVGYRSFQQEVSAGAWDAASSDLDEIEATLSQGPSAGLPVIQRIRSLELANVAILRGLVARLREEPAPPAPSRADELLARVGALARQAETRYAAGQAPAAETLYRAALSEIPEVRASYERVLGMERGRWEQERLALNRRMQALQDEVERRQQAEAARADRVSALTRALREQGSGLASTQPDPTGRVYDLLKTKALLKQVVDSAPVRAQYPELYDAMEQFFDRFGAEKLQAGEQTALASVVLLVQRLIGEKPIDTTGMSVDDLFKTLTDKLAILVRTI